MVLPTPPFWFATVITRVRRRPRPPLLANVSTCTACAASRAIGVSNSGRACPALVDRRVPLGVVSRETASPARELRSFHVKHVRRRICVSSSIRRTSRRVGSSAIRSRPPPGVPGRSRRAAPRRPRLSRPPRLRAPHRCLGVNRRTRLKIAPRGARRARSAKRARPLRASSCPPSSSSGRHHLTSRSSGATARAATQSCGRRRAPDRVVSARPESRDGPAVRVPRIVSVRNVARRNIGSTSTTRVAVARGATASPGNPAPLPTSTTARRPGAARRARRN